MNHAESGWAVTCAATALLGCATWLAGCTAPVRATGHWVDGASREQPFDRVLVVGVSPNLRQRCAFERVLARQIGQGATIAVASCDAMTQKEPLTREGIDQAVATQQADAVVATSLIDRQWDVQEGGDRDTRGGAYYKATDSGFYGVYGVPVVYGEFQTAAALDSFKREARLTTKVWETRGPTQVYTLDTTATDLESTDSAIGTIAIEIAERLARDGLVR